MKSSRPPTVNKEIWASLTSAQKKMVVEHEKMHREWLALVTRSEKSVKK